MSRLAIIPPVVLSLAIVAFAVLMGLNSARDTGESSPTPIASPQDTAADRVVVALPDGVDVRVGDNFVSPEFLGVERGTTVTFEWTGTNEHWLMSAVPGDFSTGQRSNGSYAFEFSVPGTYEIYCTVHGRSEMSARIRVE
ncbi:MAG: cupredoxin domain-containing protein [Tepidiformaceae bacterium]